MMKIFLTILINIIAWIPIAILALQIAQIAGIYDPENNEYHPTIISLVNKEKRQEWLKEGVKIKDIFTILFALILAICCLPLIFLYFLAKFICECIEKIGNITVFRVKNDLIKKNNRNG